MVTLVCSSMELKYYNSNFLKLKIWDFIEQCSSWDGGRPYHIIFHVELPK
jgi:hypothetical protein